MCGCVGVEHVVQDLDRVALPQARMARAVVRKDVLALSLGESERSGDRGPRQAAHPGGDDLVVASRLLARVHSGAGLGEVGACMAPIGAKLNFAKRRAPARGVHKSTGKIRPEGRRGRGGRDPQQLCRQAGQRQPRDRHPQRQGAKHGDHEQARSEVGDATGATPTTGRRVPTRKQVRLCGRSLAWPSARSPLAAADDSLVANPIVRLEAPCGGKRSRDARQPAKPELRRFPPDPRGLRLARRISAPGRHPGLDAETRERYNR